MSLEYVTLGVYFVFLLVIGGVFSRYNRNLGDFVRGGAKGTWWMVGTSIVMGSISAFTFTGNGSAAFQAGPTMLIIYVANVLGLLTGWLFLARWYRQTRAYTAADVIRARFGTGVEQFFAYISLLLNPFNAAIQLWALAVFVSAVFGLPLVPSIVFIGVVIVLYTASGGIWAMMANDIVQGLILFGMTILVAVLALVHIGGVGEFLRFFSDPRFADAFQFVKPPGQFPDNKFTLPWIVVIFLMQFIQQVNLGASNKFLSAKDGREASRAALWAMVLMAVGCLVWFVPPMVARFLFAPEVLAMNLKDPATAAYAVAARHVLPNGLMGIMIAAMFSATMSAMDMGLTTQTGIIVRNILPRLREALHLPPLPEESQVGLCRRATVGLGVLIISLALLLAVQDRFILFDAYLLIGSILVIPMTLPLVSGLVVRRLPHWAYFAIFGCAAAPSLYSVVLEKTGHPAWSIQNRGMWVMIFGGAATLLCAAFHRFSTAGHRAREQTFFALMFKPVDFEREVGGSFDLAQARIMSRFVLILGGLLLLFLVVPNAFSGRIAIACLAVFVLAVGALLAAGARRRLPEPPRSPPAPGTPEGSPNAR